MGFIIFAVCLCASTIGGICGIGGGVIIKPVLDALGLMSVSAISFLSGISAMMMAAISVFWQRKLHLVEVRTGSLLAVGSIVGGIAGYSLFQAIRAAAQQDALVGMVQAILLGLVTLLTLVYSAFLRSRLRSAVRHHAPEGPQVHRRHRNQVSFDTVSDRLSVNGN